MGNIIIITHNNPNYDIQVATKITREDIYRKKKTRWKSCRYKNPSHQLLVEQRHRAIGGLNKDKKWKHIGHLSPFAQMIMIGVRRVDLYKNKIEACRHSRSVEATNYMGRYRGDPSCYDVWALIPPAPPTKFHLKLPPFFPKDAMEYELFFNEIFCSPTKWRWVAKWQKLMIVDGYLTFYEDSAFCFSFLFMSLLLTIFSFDRIGRKHKIFPLFK